MQPALIQCVEFLQDLINKRASTVNSDKLPDLLFCVSELLKHDNKFLQIKVNSSAKACLVCDSLIFQRDLHRVIQLDCNKGNHLICGHVCLRRWALYKTSDNLIELEKVKCPLCDSQINQELISQAFGGKLELYQSDAYERALKQLLNDEEKEKLRARFTCLICFTELKIEEGITLECDHRFCETCIRMHVELLIESAQVSEEKLRCPSCPQPLTVYEIEEVVSPELFQKYEKFKLRGFQLTGADSDDILFQCPGADCEFFCIVEKGTTDFECPQCGKNCSPMCKEDAHPGSTCEEYRQWKRENSEADNKFEELLEAEGLLKCPECGSAVERVSGCQFMVCSSSTCQGRTYFCYDCGIKLNHDHAAHNCVPRWRNQPPVNPPPVRPPRARRGRRGRRRK